MFFHPVSNGYCLWASGWFFDELKHAYFHVPGSIVAPLGEVSTYTFFQVGGLNVPEVGNKPVLQSEQGLTHVLFTTSLACDSVNQVGASA